MAEDGPESVGVELEHAVGFAGGVRDCVKWGKGGKTLLWPTGAVVGEIYPRREGADGGRHIGEGMPDRACTPAHPLGESGWSGIPARLGHEHLR